MQTREKHILGLQISQKMEFVYKCIQVQTHEVTSILSRLYEWWYYLVFDK